MRKVLALLLIILLAFASAAGFLFLHGKITEGERRIADGQRQMEKGTAELEDGKARLEAGKLKASEGKIRYKDANGNPFLVLADKLLRGGKGFREGRERIAAGDQRVALGKDSVSVGEGKLAAGELEMRRGREQVRLAKGARVACALGAAFFASLTIVLGFRWRRSLARILRHTDT